HLLPCDAPGHVLEHQLLFGKTDIHGMLPVTPRVRAPACCQDRHSSLPPAGRRQAPPARRRARAPARRGALDPARIPPENTSLYRDGKICMDLEAWSSHLKVLADATRVRLLALLDGEELTVAELSAITRLAQPRVSTHLARLKEAGLVRDRRAGVSAYCRVDG